MQRGILKHYAHVLPRIFAERVLWQDLPRLRAWGEGHLAIDIVEGTYRSSRQGRQSLWRRRRKLWVVGELQAWLAHELSGQHDPPPDLPAMLEVDFSTTSGPRNVDAVFDITATLTSRGHVFVDYLHGPQRCGSCRISPSTHTVRSTLNPR
jgi:hypothetical protein